MLEVISAEYLEGYKISVCFSNGERGVIDLKNDLWGPVFESLKNPSGVFR